MAQATSNGCLTPSIPDTTGLACWSPGNPFADVQSSFYWSSNTREDGPFLASSALLNGGLIVNHNKLNIFYVWPVRGGNTK